MNKAPSQGRRKPTCAILSLAVPAVGVLLTLLLMRIPAIRGKSEFSTFAPAIAVCLLALPLGLTGLSLAIGAFVRRERWVPVATFGVIVNLLLILLFPILIFDL